MALPKLQADSGILTKRTFKGDPLKKAIKWIDQNEWENVRFFVLENMLLGDLGTRGNGIAEKLLLVEG